jgi:hypothetical protein
VGDGFVPEGFVPPSGLVAGELVLEPLGPQHNDADHAAWSASIGHIRATPGFEGGNWPRPMTLAENLSDLEMHARHFRERVGFTYTAREAATGVTVGCVYIYPSRDDAHDADVRSWVTEPHADLDVPLRRAVSAWLAGEAWPFERPAYAAG